jgi:sugar phosphate isomerase/epimerase
MKLSYILVDPPTTFGPIEQFGRVLRQLHEIGYQGVELSLPMPLGFDVSALKEIATDAEIEICSLLTGWSYFNDGLCLCSPDEAVRNRAVQRLLDYVRVAGVLGSILVVGQMQGFRSDEPNPEVANDRIAACLRTVSQAAVMYGVRVVLEPVNHLQVGFNNTVADVVAMVRRVGSPALKPMVDTLHMNIEERSIAEPIALAGADLAHVHLCETNGALFGTGHLNVPSVLQALASVNYQRFLSVKIYRGATWEEGATDALGFLSRTGAFLER